MTHQAENDLDLFARVEGGKIIEYPVYRIHIKNRAHPVSLYTPVVKEKEPASGEFFVTEQSVELRQDGLVYLTYKSRALTLSEMLSKFQAAASSGVAIQNPGSVSGNLPESAAIDVKEVSPETLGHVFGLIDDYVEEKLNKFASERGYRSIDRLMSYTDSKSITFSEEAKQAKGLFDDTQINLTSYLKQVQSGAMPLPTKLGDIDAILPALVWKD